RYHSQHLRDLTGLEVGDGQDRILLGDLHSYQAHLCREAGHEVDEWTAARLWVMEVATPGMHRAHAAVGGADTDVQPYCDLREIRWLLSERAGHDIGTERALLALARDVVPVDSAAKLVAPATPTAPLPAHTRARRTPRRSPSRSSPWGRMCSPPERGFPPARLSGKRRVAPRGESIG